MCNLNILITKKPSYKSYALLMERLTTLSYASNSDADGVYFSGTDKLYKSTYKLNYFDYKEDFDKSHFVISHQRFTTSGYDESNHQPFETDDFAIAHNGVLSGLGNDAVSDTREFVNIFTDTFKELEKEYKNREKCIIASIKANFKNEWGSYSIAIFDKLTDTMYYFKNTSTSLFAYHTDEYLYLGTKDNDFWINPNSKSVNVKPLNIYKCTASKKVITFKSVGEIERAEYTRHKTNTYYEDDYEDEYSDYYPKNNVKQKQIQERRFWASCDECGHKCLCSEKERYDYAIMCKECYDFRRHYEYNKGDYPKEGFSEKKWWEEYAKRGGK